MSPRGSSCERCGGASGAAACGDSAGITQPMRAESVWVAAEAACPRPPRGGVLLTARGAGAGSRAAHRAGPKDRAAPLTRAAERRGTGRLAATTAGPRPGAGSRPRRQRRGRFHPGELSRREPNSGQRLSIGRRSCLGFGCRLVCSAAFLTAVTMAEGVDCVRACRSEPRGQSNLRIWTGQRIDVAEGRSRPRRICDHGDTSGPDLCRLRRPYEANDKMNVWQKFPCDCQRMPAAPVRRLARTNSEPSRQDAGLLLANAFGEASTQCHSVRSWPLLTSQSTRQTPMLSRPDAGFSWSARCDGRLELRGCKRRDHDRRRDPSWSGDASGPLRVSCSYEPEPSWQDVRFVPGRSLPGSVHTMPLSPRNATQSTCRTAVLSRHDAGFSWSAGMRELP